VKTPRVLLTALLLATPALADEALDRVSKGLEALAAHEGYTMKADWTIDVEKVGPEKGTVETRGMVDTTVRQKEDLIRLHAKFDEGEVTIFQKGTRIAGQDPESKEWGPVAGQEMERAKFVVKMFNLKSFLTQAQGMAVNARFVKAEKDEWLAVEFDAEPAALDKLLVDAGNAAIGTKLNTPTMKVRLQVERGSNEIRDLEVTIEGDAKEEILPAGEKKEDDLTPWGEDETQPNGAPGKPQGPKNPEPKAPVVQHVKIWIHAVPNYVNDLTIEVPEGAKKTLGLGN